MTCFFFLLQAFSDNSDNEFKKPKLKKTTDCNLTIISSSDSEDDAEIDQVGKPDAPG